MTDRVTVQTEATADLHRCIEDERGTIDGCGGLCCGCCS